MTVSRKRKRSIIVDGREYLWFVVEGLELVPVLRIVTPDGDQFAEHQIPPAPDPTLFPDGPPGVITPSVVETLIRHRPRGEQAAPPAFATLALDLEGTLVSNAMSQFPRAGLRPFLELVHRHVPRVVIYTAVAERIFRPIARTLVAEEIAPDWFASIEYIDWSGPHKDLSFIPSCDPQCCLLIDDNPDYVSPGQKDRWFQIPEFAHPYGPDRALAKAWDFVRMKNAATYRWPDLDIDVS